MSNLRRQFDLQTPPQDAQHYAALISKAAALNDSKWEQLKIALRQVAREDRIKLINWLGENLSDYISQTFGDHGLSTILEELPNEHRTALLRQLGVDLPKFMDSETLDFVPEEDRIDCFASCDSVSTEIANIKRNQGAEKFEAIFALLQKLFSDYKPFQLQIAFRLVAPEDRIKLTSWLGENLSVYIFPRGCRYDLNSLLEKLPDADRAALLRQVGTDLWQFFDNQTLNYVPKKDRSALTEEAKLGKLQLSPDSPTKRAFTSKPFVNAPSSQAPQLISQPPIISQQASRPAITTQPQPVTPTKATAVASTLFANAPSTPAPQFASLPPSISQPQIPSEIKKFEAAMRSLCRELDDRETDKTNFKLTRSKLVLACLQAAIKSDANQANKDLPAYYALFNKINAIHSNPVKRFFSFISSPPVSSSRFTEVLKEKGISVPAVSVEIEDEVINNLNTAENVKQLIGKLSSAVIFKIS